MSSASNHIAPPPPVFGMDRIAVLGIAAMIAVFPLLTRNAQIAAWLTTALVTVWVWVRRSPAPSHIGIFGSASMALFILGVPFSQIVFGLGMLVYVLIVWRTSWLNGALNWARLGTVNPRALLMTAAIVLIAAIALGAWLLIARPNLRDLVENFIPHPARWWFLLTGALMFSLVNAAVEEIAYRGILMYALEAAVGTGIAAVVLQAIAFGTLHIDGFPRGWIGVGLAGIYGAALGMLRCYTRGMVAPWVAHVLTDLTIAGMLLGYATR